jgi:cytochrome c oxidase subunit 3
MDLTLGGINTFVLLVSSAIMALAVDAARTGKRAQLTRLLTVTAVLGIVFLAIKGIEYQHHFVEGLAPGLNWTYAGPRPQEVELFMVAYFTMTGLHAIHLTIAVALIAFMALRARRETHVPLKHTGYELLGLYWHFVDIIWVFLLPLLYLFGLQA